MNCGLKYRSLLFSHKNYLEVGSVVNGSLAQQCSQGFRFYLSSLTSIESWILLYMYAPSHEISIWLPQAQTSCYFQAQMKGACNQGKKKKKFQKPSENVVDQNWVILSPLATKDDERISISLFHIVQWEIDKRDNNWECALG